MASVWRERRDDDPSDRWPQLIRRRPEGRFAGSRFWVDAADVGQRRVPARVSSTIATSSRRTVIGNFSPVDSTAKPRPASARLRATVEVTLTRTMEPADIQKGNCLLTTVERSQTRATILMADDGSTDEPASVRALFRRPPDSTAEPRIGGRRNAASVRSTPPRSSVGTRGVGRSALQKRFSTLSICIPHQASAGETFPK